MKFRNLIALSALGATAFMATACASTSKRLGLTQSAPNEFNILTKAPLVVPPEYNLRPPRIGESSSTNNYSQETARNALIGEIDAAEPSQGEAILLSQAGALRADQEIRLKIDGQNSVERKSSGFTDRVLFWTDGQAYSGVNAPLDAEQEAARLQAIQSATGGGQVEITRRPGSAKLPGL